MKIKKLNKYTIMNSLKIVLAATIAVLLAKGFQLTSVMSAGIIAILTIQPTKRETINTAVGRMIAFVVAMGIGYVCYTLIGFRVEAFLVYLIPYIFICQIFNWQSAMTMNSVLLSHFVAAGSMNVQTVSNEVFIFMIGVGCGVIANLHLHKRSAYIMELQEETDKQIVQVLYRMSERIMDKDVSDYNADCFECLKEILREAKSVAKENYNNQFDRTDIFDLEYVRMRERQCQVLYEMYKNIRKLGSSPRTAKRISVFLEDMAISFQRENDGKILMLEFEQMDKFMKSQPLPVERQEFEDRARLFTFMRSIEEFIEIKMLFSEEMIEKVDGDCS